MTRRSKGTGSVDEYRTRDGQRRWKVSAKIGDRERSKSGFTTRAAGLLGGLLDEPADLALFEA